MIRQRVNDANTLTIVCFWETTYKVTRNCIGLIRPVPVQLELFAVIIGSVLYFWDMIIIEKRIGQAIWLIV